MSRHEPPPGVASVRSPTQRAARASPAVRNDQRIGFSDDTAGKDEQSDTLH
jgi:hypothetical protein